MSRRTGLRILCVSVGAASTEETRAEHARLLGALAGAECGTMSTVAVGCEADVEQAVAQAARTQADVLALVALCGRTAPLQVAVVQSVALPAAVWAVGRDYAFPSSALATGALRDEGRPVALFHAAVDDADTMAGFTAALRAGAAATRLRRARIGVIGGLFPNLVSCRYQPAVVTERLGAELVPIPYDRLRQEMQEAARQRAAVDRLLEHCGRYEVHVPPEALVPGLHLHLALKSLAAQLGLEAFAVECWSGLPGAVGLNPCLGFVEDAYTLACEGDVLLALLLLMVRYTTGVPAHAGDVRHLDGDGVLTMCHCSGPATAASHVILDLSAAAQAAGFRTVTCRPRVDPGPVTMARLYGDRCDRMHVACGDLLACDRSADLTLSVRLRGPRADFVRACLGNHYAVVPGDIRQELAFLGECLGITVACT